MSGADVEWAPLGEKAGVDFGCPVSDSSAFEKVINFSAVHQSMIPGAWNRILMDTWPENFIVIGFSPGSDVNVVVESIGKMHARRSTAVVVDAIP